MSGRLGVLGGTFDPPHIGHRVVAQDVVERLELDHLIVVPAARPVHRSAVFPAAARLEWTRRMFERDARFEVSDIEFARSGPSYMVDTLAEIRRTRSPAVLYCVIGADQWATFAEWRAPERIVRLATVAVMTRGGEMPLPTSAPYAFEQVPVTRVDLSGSRIRCRLEAGRSLRYLVPECVRTDIEKAWQVRIRRKGTIQESAATSAGTPEREH